MCYDLSEGKSSWVPYEVADVRQPNLSVGRLVDLGYQVNLKANGGRVVFPGELGWLSMHKCGNNVYLATDISERDVDMNDVGHP